MLGELQPWMPGWPSLERFRREMDDLFSRFFGDTEVRGADGTASILPAAESFFKDGKWVMRFDLPGVEPKDIDVSVTGDILTVRASRERRQEHRDAEYERREVEYGRFERSITLPKGVDAEKIKANYQHGVLELTMPVAPEMQGRKIPVEAGAEKKQLEHRAA
ncbi:Hsp20/alpha crystallin family protein [bacterium]|jgi:HSP20 family protein|nr:Hsp20/alpha crystallin family protein [bacterium]